MTRTELLLSLALIGQAIYNMANFYGMRKLHMRVTALEHKKAGVSK